MGSLMRSTLGFKRKRRYILFLKHGNEHKTQKKNKKDLIFVHSVRNVFCALLVWMPTVEYII